MANGAQQARRDRWMPTSGYDLDVVVGLALDDLDEGETRFAELRAEIRSMKGLLWGLVVSIATAAVLLALNLGVAGR